MNHDFFPTLPDRAIYNNKHNRSIRIPMSGVATSGQGGQLPPLLIRNFGNTLIMSL